MKLFQSVFHQGKWSPALPAEDCQHQFVLAFGNEALYASAIADLQSCFSHAEVVGCTTSGEIQATELHDNSLCITALHFEHGHLQVAQANAEAFTNSKSLAEALIIQLPADNLRHVLVFSDGQQINGTDLVAGLNQALPDNVFATGGLAGDGDRFERTFVWHNSEIASGLVVAVGLYGAELKIGYGHLGGWRAFGPTRNITESNANVLMKLDDRPALELYKEFLGEHANDLPASALLFPLAMKLPNEQQTVVRTILNIDEQQQSMTFAGNMPEGASCQLMRANYDNLVDGATGAANNAIAQFTHHQPAFALLISCVGRRLVLGQMVEEELEAVQETLGEDCKMTGFYSYGEISPIGIGRCELHNQTMTITLLSETSS